MKRIKKIIMCILGGIIVMGLAGCNKEAEIKSELAPMFEVLDNQSLDGYNILSINDSIDIYSADSMEGFQLDLNQVQENEFVGQGYDLSISETDGYPAIYKDSNLKIETDNTSFLEYQLGFEEFHFSKDYFAGLEFIEVYDHPNTYMKDMSFQEKSPSTYTKRLIDEYNLTSPTAAKIEVGKRRHDEKSFSYILTYSLYDKTDIKIVRVFKFVMGDMLDE